MFIQNLTVDINSSKKLPVTCVAHVNDLNSRCIDVSVLVSNIPLDLTTYTATASYVVDKFVLNDSVDCEINPNENDVNVVRVFLGEDKIGNICSGIMTIEITLKNKDDENGEMKISPPFAIQVLVGKSNLKNAKAYNPNFSGLIPYELHKALSNKEDTTNKVTSFDELFKDTDKYPSVIAVINYLKDYYYTADEIDGILPDSGGGITEEDLAEIKAELSQIETPMYANSVDECTDTSKLYVLPDGYIYAYTTKTTTHTPVNQIKGSIDTDGTSYNDGIGYITGYTIHGSDGSDYSGSSVDRVTGYISCKNGDYIRSNGIGFKSTAGYKRIAFYDADFTCLIVLSTGSTTKPLDDYLDGENLSFNISDIELLTEEQKEKVAYIRASCNDIGPNSIITVNESTETTTETVTDWHNTNLAFIPADYEDRIIALENNRYSKSRHDGKVCVCFGDSIVANMAEPNDYPSVLADETGMTVYNVGFGGCRMSASMSTVYNAYSMVKLADAITTGDWTEQENGLSSVNISHYAPHIETLKSIDWNKVDFITIGYGTNDIANFVDVDNTEKPLDTTTVLGGLRYSLNTILTAYPHIKVLILTPIYRYFNDEGVDSNEKEWYEQRKFTTWTDGILDVAKEYGVPAVDMYRTLGFNKLTRNYYFPSNDGTHPNEIGLKVIGGKIAGKLLSEY